MTFGPRRKKVIARILTHPKCSYAVCWRKPIRHVVLGYSFWSRLLALLREEFRISKLTLHSDLRQRVALHLVCHAHLVFDIFCMYKKYFCEIMRLQRPRFRWTTWTIVNPALTGIGIGIGQYYWVLGALFGIILTLPSSLEKSRGMAFTLITRIYASRFHTY